MASKTRAAIFINKCHEGFSIAQVEIVKYLPSLEEELPNLRDLYKKEVRRYKKERSGPAPRYSEAGKQLADQLFKCQALREIANSIAWKILEDDGTKVRALIQGVAPAPLDKGVLRKTLTTATAFNQRNKEGFALIADITSCIQVGDLLVRLPGGNVGISELKEGTINDHISDLLEMSPKDPTTLQRLEKLTSEYGLPFVRQIERDLRQRQRMARSLSYMNKSIGIDIQSGLRKITDIKPKIVTTYHEELTDLLKKVRGGRREAFCFIDDCLVLGAFKSEISTRSPDVCKMDFQHYVWHLLFEEWPRCPYGKSFNEEAAKKHFEYMRLPIFSLREKIHFPTHQPIFISGLNKSAVFDILFQRVSVFFYFSPERFVARCRTMGIDATRITGKEYRRAKGEALKNGIHLLDLHGGIIKLENKTEKQIVHIALGSLWKIIYEFQRPSSLAALWKENLETLPEQSKRMEEFEREQETGRHDQ